MIRNPRFSDWHCRSRSIERHTTNQVRLYVRLEKLLLQDLTPLTWEDRKIVAIEILDAGKRTQKNALNQLDLSIVREAAVV